MAKKKPRPRRAFTPEFKTGIVERCLIGDRSIGGQVANNRQLPQRRNVHKDEPVFQQRVNKCPCKC